MGLVTEVDLAEALAPLRVLRLAFWLLFGLLTAGAVVVFVLMRLARRFHEKARQASLEAKRLGHYTLDDEIGSGAFGTVFRGHHALMRRPVAVKVLNLLAGEMGIARFEREVQMTCQSTHLYYHRPLRLWPHRRRLVLLCDGASTGSAWPG